MEVKKVTGNLHIVRMLPSSSPTACSHLPPQTTLGHGYLSWEHTDHARELLETIWRAQMLTSPAVMNLSHVIHEFSFGPYFPRIVQPLDNSVYVLCDSTQRSER